MLTSCRLPPILIQGAADAYNAAHSLAAKAFSSLWYQPLGRFGTTGTISRPSLKLNRQVLTLVACIAAIFWLVTFPAAHSHDDVLAPAQENEALPASQTAQPPIGAGASRAGLTKDRFLDAVLTNPVEGLLDPEPIRRKCNETIVHEGLVWHCAAVVGGVGNVGNMLLNCVRYALEAGAETLILPRLGMRSGNLVDLGGESQSVDLAKLFDVSHFLSGWIESCPQIRAVISDAEVPGLPSTDSSPHLYPQNVKEFPMRKYLVVDPTGWREAFDSWMANEESLQHMTRENPKRVWQNMVMAQWNREAPANPPDFAKSFPRLFRFPQRTRRLAAAALWSMENRTGSAMVADAIVDRSRASSESLVTSLGPGRLALRGFLGAHLRVAADAVKAGWPGYEAQVPYYIAEALRLNLTTIYLATGSPEHRDLFRKDAAQKGLTVFVKEDLLDEVELAELRTLSWDQQALVDFDVLTHSAFFAGFVRSSFSWAIALRRGILPEAKVTKPSGQMQTAEDEYRDQLSVIVGRRENINPEGIWP